MSQALVGRVVAITGGARGIGRAVAAHLARSGAHVAIGDRDLEQARASAAQLPGSVEAFDCDVTDTSSFSAFLDSARERFGPIDVLVNNAGLMWVGPFDQEPEAAARRQIEVNLHGTIRGVKLAAPAMRGRGRGHIITIASAAARLPPAGEATYAATKHGVLGYLSGVRSELRGSGVELSVVLPGVVQTELAAGTATGAARLLTPEEVARAVAGLVRRPRFEVSLPAHVGPLARWVQVLPQRLRDFLLRLAVPDQIAALPDKSARHSYENRNLTGPQSAGEEP